MIIRWGVKLPGRGDLPAQPRGLVYHWTGGGWRANATDLEHYHYVVEIDGTVMKGLYDVRDNMRRLGGDEAYAHHTGGFNSFRIAVAVAGMRGYTGPKSLGAFPIGALQVKRMCEIGAYFCSTFDMDPLEPVHVCTHQEVWTLHGIKGQQNHLKRDIDILPFRPDIRPEQVGPELRQLTALYASPLLAEAVEFERIAWPTPRIVVPEAPAPAPVLPKDTTQPWWNRLLARIRAPNSGG